MKNLGRTMIWTACFLEHSGDDIIDPDSAAEALEDIAAGSHMQTVRGHRPMEEREA